MAKCARASIVLVNSLLAVILEDGVSEWVRVQIAPEVERVQNVIKGLYTISDSKWILTITCLVFSEGSVGFFAVFIV